MFRSKWKGMSVMGVFVLATAVAAAQDSTRTVGLAEAVQLGVANSKQLAFSKAKLAEAVAATREARERKLPDASISGSYMRLTHANVSMKTGSDSAGGGGPKINQALYGMASVSLPLFAGGKIRYGIESARYLEKAVELDAAQDRPEVILNCTAAYINLYKALKTVSLIEENLVQSAERDKELANLEKNGLLARNDLLKSQLETANYELALLDARNQAALAMVNLNLLIGLPERTKLQLDSASIIRPADLAPLENYLSAADQRNDIKALDQRRQAAAGGIQVARADYYPSFAVTGGYVAVDVPKFLTVTNAFNVGLGLKYNLSSLWKTTAKIEQARARETQLLASQAMLQDQVHVAVNKAYQDFLSTGKKIEVYNRAVDQAVENYRISRNKYNNSLLTLSDLLDADVLQLRARIDLEMATADLTLAYQTLLQQAGMIQ